MAERPVFLPVFNDQRFVDVDFIEFKWFAGMSVSQKQRSVDSLHQATRKTKHDIRLLEISSKSTSALGVNLSAFNLSFTTQKHNLTMSVESAFQGSKVFERGGPYKDLFWCTSRDAKRDPRLVSSGRLICFEFFKDRWPLEPLTSFYDWLYINALSKQPGSVIDELLAYNAFTDIEFNPDKSINCQAHSAALFVSLVKKGKLEFALSSKENYLSLLSGRLSNNQGPQEDFFGSVPKSP